MAWIKRNLGFLISSVIAVVLLGAAGYYTYSNYQLNKATLEKLNSAYEELRSIVGSNPNAGNDLTNNITRAQEQRTNVLKVIEKTRQFFAPVPPIPNSPKVTDQDFYLALRRTLAQFNSDASRSSVILPADYYFSFRAQSDLAIFSAGSTERLAVKLGEVKAICDVLFQAKVNSLYNLRRERVSDDDVRGPASDYLDLKSVTNNLAVITPYEITFYCFSPELAGVLAGFASAPHGFVVKTINVESGSGLSAPTADHMGTPAPPPVASTGPMSVVEEAMSPRERARAAAAAGARTPTAPTPAPAPAGPGQTQGGPGTPAMTKGGLQILVNEKLLKVTIMLNVVKTLPPGAPTGGSTRK